MVKEILEICTQHMFVGPDSFHGRVLMVVF